MPVFGQSKGSNVPEKFAAPSVSKTQAVKADPKTLEALQGSKKKNEGDEDRFTFWDFLDIINPLQHIPIIATIYRAITGDEIKPPARVLGDGLYGGPIGMATGLVSAMVEETTGKDVGAHTLALFTRDKEEDQIMVAQGGEGDLDEIETSAGDGAGVSQQTSELALSVQPPDHTVRAASITRPADHTPPPPDEMPATTPVRAHPTSVSPPQGDGQTKTVAGAMFSPEVDSKANDVLAAAGGSGLPPERIADAMMQALEKYEAMKQQQWQQSVYNRNERAPQLVRPKLDLLY